MEGMNEGTAGGRVVVVLRGKPACHSGLNSIFWDAWNLITSNGLTWGHRWAHQHWAHSQPPVQSPPCSVAGTARTLKFLIIVYFHHIATKIAIQRARNGLQYCEKCSPRLMGSSSGGACESSSRSWPSEICSGQVRELVCSDNHNHCKATKDVILKR